MAAAAAILGGAVSVPGIALPMKQTAELFERQIAQDKKFFYASYAEAVAHHSEAYGQAARCAPLSKNVRTCGRCDKCGTSQAARAELCAEHCRILAG